MRLGNKGTHDLGCRAVPGSAPIALPGAHGHNTLAFLTSKPAFSLGSFTGELRTWICSFNLPTLSSLVLKWHISRMSSVLRKVSGKRPARFLVGCEH